MDGILAVWKPEGWTSHDVVAKVRRLLKMKRIGHAGTLDPMVTGVLPLCLGRSTRVVEYVQDRPKAYTATLRLGIATDTEDITGDVIERSDHVSVSLEQVQAALTRFEGTIDQVPPMFSAVKVDGKRLYELAREGKTVERKSRKVHIYQIELLSTNLQAEEPEITFSVECSKGTYIRTLCVDIGKALGVPATMAKLIRTMSGGITEESCLTIEQIEQLAQADKLTDHLLAADEAISHIPESVVDDAIGERALQGQKIRLQAANIQQAEWENGQIVRLYNRSRIFLGIFQIDTAASLLKPIKVFSAI
ncbi:MULTISPECIES: tRNA pseudouridine(55) synthase TruB [unclassified Paenibacillus]|uniref:tRNA pseudouridine(55) synthase TruB n=1 Tax=unclassified Paenibacillus TaxID=185978 RepID=UPI002F3FD15F